MAGGERHVALLRGVNVGGKNKLPMKTLVEIFMAAGCREVRSYIQSGNVVFAASPTLARRIPSVIGAAIQKQLGLSLPVVTRSTSELASVARNNPFLRAGADPAALHVAFLAQAPNKAQIAALDPARSPPDELLVRGREVFLHLPNGVARSKLSNQYLDSKLDTVSTIRNWRTVLTLLEMLAQGKV